MSVQVEKFISILQMEYTTVQLPISIAGDNSRLLHGALKVIPLEPFDTKKSSDGDGTRVLASDETGSFDIDVLALDPSKISSATSTASKVAGTAPFTTTMSSLASGVIVGGISLFLFM